MTPLFSWKLHRIVQHLCAGGVIAYPTEAVYGLGCDPLNEKAVKRVLALKNRPADKGLILIGADFHQLEPFLEIPDPILAKKIRAAWPGPTTWLIPARRWVPYWLRGQHDTLAVRITAHPVASALCRAFQAPLVSTSANKSGLPPARTALKVRQYFKDPRLMIIVGPTGGLEQPTAIYDALSGRRLR